MSELCLKFCETHQERTILFQLWKESQIQQKAKLGKLVSVNVCFLFTICQASKDSKDILITLCTGCGDWRQLFWHQWVDFPTFQNYHLVFFQKKENHPGSTDSKFFFFAKHYRSTQIKDVLNLPPFLNDSCPHLHTTIRVHQHRISIQGRLQKTGPLSEFFY